MERNSNTLVPALGLAMLAWMATGLTAWLLPGPPLALLPVAVLTCVSALLAACVLNGYQPAQAEYVLSVAERDALTGLPDMRAFRRELAGRFDRAGDYAHPFALVLLAFNHPPHAGLLPAERSLASLALVLNAMVRASDMAARTGPDEFGLLLTGADRAAAVRLIERVEQALEDWSLDLGTHGTGETGRRLRYGIAVYSPVMLSDEELLRVAQHYLHASTRHSPNIGSN